MSEKNHSHGNNASENMNERFENQYLTYEELEKSGLNYISKQQTYLVLSLIFPTFLSVIQIFNIIFIVILERNGTSDIPMNPFFVIINLGPILFFLMTSLFGLIIFIFLIEWNKKVNLYKNQRKLNVYENQSKLEDGFSRKTISLTTIFYNIIDIMRTLRIIFIVLNIICFNHFAWIISYFFFRRLPPTDQYRPPRNFLSIFTAISQIILILYLLYEWRHFYRWNKKLKMLGKFERKLYSELFQSKNNHNYS